MQFLNKVIEVHRILWSTSKNLLFRKTRRADRDGSAMSIAYFYEITKS